MDRKTGKAGIKKSVVCFLCICLLGISGIGCAGKDTGASHADAKNSVVVVAEYVSLNGEEVGLGHGSGFFIGNKGKDPQYLITNHHVIADYQFYGSGTLYRDEEGNTYDLKSYLRVYYDSSDYEEAYIVAYNEVADVAVLRLDAPTDKRQALQLCSPTNDMVGDSVYAIGYPGISDNMFIDSVTKWGQKDATFTSGVISRLTTTSGTGVKNVQMDAAIAAGNSGGPLVNEKGSAVGVNRGIVSNEGGEESDYAVNIDEVISLLDLHNVAYEMESASGSGTDKNFLLIGGIAGAAAVAIILVVVLLAKGKKQPAAGNAANISAASAADAAPTGPVRQPETPSLMPKETPKAANAQDSGYRLQGISGALEGRRFMIKKDSPLILGRSSEDCNVVYPPNTAGVSGRHCEVYYDHGQIMVRDIGSSHGTFYGTGTKISAGQPIRLMPGECIWLGSEKETMVLAQKGGN